MIPGTPSISAIWLALLRPAGGAVGRSPRRTAERAGLRGADLRIVLLRHRRQAEVEQLQVVVALGEAEEVREVVHAVVHGEQVHRDRAQVIAIGVRDLAGDDLEQAAAGFVPGVVEVEVVLAIERERRIEQRRRQRTDRRRRR